MLPRGIWKSRDLSGGRPAPASPRPAASSPPLFSGPLVTALSQLCGPCDFPYPGGCLLHPLWLLPFLGRKPGLCRPGGRPGDSTAGPELPSPCCSCRPAPCAVCSGVGALQRREGFRRLSFSVSRFIEEKTAALSSILKPRDLRMSGNIFCYLVTLSEWSSMSCMTF